MKAVFIGLGRMGSGMAGRILGAGLPLGVHNRTKGKEGPLRDQGAQTFGSLEEALAGAGLVLTMLSDDPALGEVINEGTARLLAPGAVHVSHSTVSPAAARKAAKALEGNGGLGLSAPVMGRPDIAAQGTLRLLLSGPAKAKELAAPYLAPMGKVSDFGTDPAAAPQVKLAFNLMIAATIETLSEAFSLVEKNGVDPRAFFDLVHGSLFSAPAIKTYGELLLGGEFGSAGFLASLGKKDVSLVTGEGRASLIPLPLAELLEARFTRAINRGWADKDWCVISELQREDAGLPPKKPGGR
jgi:3-hydroxyisobutyrate dehydrogenase-like beta-hydroxyacid dehydrogenase